MATPTKKNPELEKLIDTLNPSGRKRTESIEGNFCFICGGDANTFRDALSKKEYTISGMCQACQDKIFGKGD